MTKNALMVVVVIRIFFGIGTCDYPSESAGLEGFVFLLFVIPLLLIIAGISIILCKKCCKNSKSENNGLEKKKE